MNEHLVILNTPSPPTSTGPVLAVMAPRLAVCTRSDMVWQRVCWKLLEDVPQRCVESVLTGLVQAVSG